MRFMEKFGKFSAESKLSNLLKGADFIFNSAHVWNVISTV